MKTIQLLFIIVVFDVAAWVALAAPETSPIDTPLHFTSFEDLCRYETSKECFAVHSELSSCLTFIELHGPLSRDFRSKDGTGILCLINGQTPRCLMLWSLAMQIDRSKMAILSDQLSLANHESLRPGETFEDASVLYKIRIREAEGWIVCCQKLLDSIKPPNKALATVSNRQE